MDEAGASERRQGIGDAHGRGGAAQLAGQLLGGQVGGRVLQEQAQDHAIIEVVWAYGGARPPPGADPVALWLRRPSLVVLEPD